MEVFRLAVAEHADLSGLGGVYAPARWHYAGKPILYTASSRSLAVLERFIHEHDLENLSLMMLVIHVPADVSMMRYTHHELLKHWDTVNKADHQSTQDIGSDFLAQKRQAILQVPSAIVPHEYNFLINPLHQDVKRIKLVDAHPYYYDKRYQRFIKESK